MKNKWRYGLVILAVVVVVLCVLLHQNTWRSQNPPVEEAAQEIYDIMPAENRLVGRAATFTGQTQLSQVQDALQQMRQVPVGESLQPALPEEVQVLHTALEAGQVVVDLSAEYLTLETGGQMFLRGGVVWTLTSLPFVDEVQFFVEGEPMLRPNGEAYGALSRENLIIDPVIDAEPTNARRVLTLYFAAAEGFGLVEEERTVEVNPNQALEQYVMEELIRGPQQEGHRATVPSATTIRSIETADGTCYVDLSASFVTSHAGGAQEDALTVYSIVDSLCALEDVDRVQFLIEGEKQDAFHSLRGFDQPYGPTSLSEGEGQP